MPKAFSKTELSTEIWKWVPGFKGHYELSNLGRVRSYLFGGVNRKRFLRKDPKYSKVFGRHRYRSCFVNTKGKHFNVSIPGMIMLAFIGKRPKGHHVCHIDGNYRNNRLSNLKYGSPTENSRDRINHGTVPYGEKCYNSKFTTSAVQDILANYKWHSRSLGIRHFAKKHGVSEITVSYAINRKIWKHVKPLKESS